MRALLLACSVTAAPALAVVAPPPSGQAPRFPSTVEQVLVDVVVLDRDGAPVGGLTRDDFLLKEDGAAQSIVSFEAVEVAPGPARDALEPLPSVSANPAAGGRPPGRTFLVVFDDTRLSVAQGEAAK